MGADGERKRPGRTEEPSRGSLQRSLALQSKELRKNLGRPLESMQVALRQELILSFPHFQSFVAQCSSNLSMTGMFVPTETPASPGTLVDFEFRLVDGLILIHGQAEVAWVRRTHRMADRRPGMGLRFLRLDSESRRLIRWLVEKHLAEQGALVDLEGMSKAGTDLDLRKLYPYAGVGIARPGILRRGRRRLRPREPRPKKPLSKTPRWRRGGLIAATVLVLLVAGGFLQRSGSRTALSGAVDPAPSAEAEASEGRQSGLFEIVAAWVQESSGGVWETSFQSTQPPGTELETSLKAEFLSADRARVSYLRRQTSGDREDTVRAALVLALEDGRWQVLEEVEQKKLSSQREPAAADGFVQRAGTVQVLKPLSLRDGEPTASARRVRVIQPGAVLEHVGWTTRGEAVGGNAHWYQDLDGNYFWAGGTAAPAPGA